MRLDWIRIAQSNRSNCLDEVDESNEWHQCKKKKKKKKKWRLIIEIKLNEIGIKSSGWRVKR